MNKYAKGIVSLFLLPLLLLDAAPVTLAVGGEFVIENNILIAYHGNGGAVSIPGGVTAIGDGAFSGSETLTSVVIPTGVVSIGQEAFYQCSGLQAVSLPEGLRTIGANAFSQCTALRAVAVPAGVTSLRHGFSQCSALEEVRLPAGLTDLYGAFSHCTGLQSIQVPEGVVDMSWAFAYCTSLETATIPSTVRKVDSAFLGCAALTAAKLPVGVTALAKTFSGCDSLVAVSLPEGLTTIGDEAFAGTGSLAELHIPESVTYIGYRAFYGSAGLKTVTLPKNLTVAAEESFWNCGALRSVVAMNPDMILGPMAFPQRTTIFGYPSTSAQNQARLAGLQFLPISRETVVQPGDFAATLDGAPIGLRSYVYTNASGGDTNYVMLRDVAAMLNGTQAQFAVDWSAADGISIATGQPYSAVGGELRGKALDARPYTRSADSMTVDGEPVELTAFLIEGNNYFTLRDLGELLHFSVSWENQTVVIRTGN